MIKHQNKEFPSDLFLILETVGAQVAVASGPTTADINVISIEGFLGINMAKKVLVKIILPARDSDRFTLKTYKVIDQWATYN